MLFSTGAAMYLERTDKSDLKEITYRDVKFKQTDYGSWKFSVSNYDFETKYLPQDLSNISLSTTKILSDYNGKVLYFSGEPFTEVSVPSMQEIARLLEPFVLRTNYACLSSNCGQNYAIKNCSVDNVVIFKRSATNSSKIIDNEKCVTIEYNDNAAGEDEKVADAFFYRLIGMQ